MACVINFPSIEPQLSNIKFSSEYKNEIDWVIQGGESGLNKRLFDLEWAYGLKEQLNILGIPFFFKQIDKVKEIPQDLQVRMFPVN